MKQTIGILAGLAMVALFAQEARAEAPGFQKHDGFLLRLTAGVGYGYASASQGGKSYSMQGVSALTDIGIGYCVIENLALTFDIFGGGRPTKPRVQTKFPQRVDGTDTPPPDKRK